MKIFKVISGFFRLPYDILAELKKLNQQVRDVVSKETHIHVRSI
jgi:hypothetical protein